MSDDAWLTRCVVNTTSRSFRLYSSDGNEREVTCDTPEEFMNVLQLCRETLDEDTLAYSSPLVSES
tara:strand:+ start:464 stop:661 length:198 start_codon:yes stop_codon:yes gene_type:complete